MEDDEEIPGGEDRVQEGLVRVDRMLSLDYSGLKEGFKARNDKVRFPTQSTLSTQST